MSRRRMMAAPGIDRRRPWQIERRSADRELHTSTAYRTRCRRLAPDARRLPKSSPPTYRGRILECPVHRQPRDIDDIFQREWYAVHGRIVPAMISASARRAVIVGFSGRADEDSAALRELVDARHPLAYIRPATACAPGSARSPRRYRDRRDRSSPTRSWLASLNAFAARTVVLEAQHRRDLLVPVQIFRQALPQGLVRLQAAASSAISASVSLSSPASVAPCARRRAASSCPPVDFPTKCPVRNRQGGKIRADCKPPSPCGEAGMIDHVSLGVADLSRSAVLYETMLGPLGHRRLVVSSARNRLRREISAGVAECAASHGSDRSRTPARTSACARGRAKRSMLSMPRGASARCDRRWFTWTTAGDAGRVLRRFYPRTSMAIGSK